MNRTQFPYWIAQVAVTLAVLWSSGDPLFWDTIQLAGKQADWYFQNDFRHFFLPERIDSGHPPVFGMYLAGWWSLFGRSLLVSHLAMLPIVWLLVAGVWRVSRHWLDDDALWGLLIVFCDPVLLGQLLLVSPDLWLVAAFAWTLAGILEGRNDWKMMGVIGLCLISTRGMMTSVALLLFDLVGKHHFSFSSAKKILLGYLPGAALGAGFLVAHALHTGWIGYHPDSPWAGSFKTVDAGGLAKNVVLYVWRWLDFGRVGLWLILLGLGVQNWRNRRQNRIALPRANTKPPRFSKPWRFKSESWANLREPLLLLVLLIAFSLPTFLRYVGLNGHRYLLPCLLTFGWCFVAVVRVFPAKKWLLPLGLAFLASGNLWIYPPHISQQWDGSLAYRGHFTARAAALEFLAQEEIPLHQVGTVFPEIGPRDWRELNGDTTGMVRFAVGKQPYVLVMTTMNDFPDELHERGFGDLIFECCHWRICARIHAAEPKQ